MVHQEHSVDFALQELDVWMGAAGWEQLEGWVGGGGVIKRLQPHIRTTIPPSVQYRATDHFRQQLRSHLHEQGHQGVECPAHRRAPLVNHTLNP